MSNRVTSDSGNTVSLFPFLAVLLCTMGALLVLLVVLAQRAGERGVTEAVQTPEPVEAVEVVEQDSRENQEESEQLAQELEEILARSREVEKLRKQADERLRAEQEKLTHLEDHTRRLEHEIGRLSAAAEQMAATEKNQVVHQEQAENELARLKQLLAEHEEQVKQLQEESKGKRTFAIVPFVGKDGTTAQRIYIECRGDGIYVQPEGTKFARADFLDEQWAGNPLAQVVRATQDHVRSQAVEAENTASAEALPLLIVRPDGILALEYARTALEAAEIGYGFDYVGGDHGLQYPVSLDPILAQKQQHAQMIARQQLAMQLQSAPSRYKAKLESIAVGAGRMGVGTANVKAAILRQLTGGARESLANGGNSLDGEGGGSGTGVASQESGSVAGQQYFRIGDIQSTAEDPEDGSGAGAVGLAAMQPGGNGDQSDPSPTGADIAASGEHGQQLGQLSGSAGGTQGNAAMSGGPPSQSAMTGARGNAFGSSGAGSSNNQTQAAGKASANELAKRQRNSVPMQRPIQVIVRKDHVAILPEQSVGPSEVAPGATISLSQSPKQIGAELSVAIRNHVEDWGIAGSGLYWKPVLNLKVGPDGWESARRLEKMLSRSGIKVKLPETANRNAGDNNATR